MEHKRAGLLSTEFTAAIQASIADKCSAQVATFADDDIPDSSSRLSERVLSVMDLRSALSVKCFHQPAAVSSSFNFLFSDFPFQATM